jgi:hypothetical protein
MKIYVLVGSEDYRCDDNIVVTNDVNVFERAKLKELSEDNRHDRYHDRYSYEIWENGKKIESGDVK